MTNNDLIAFVTEPYFFINSFLSSLVRRTLVVEVAPFGAGRPAPGREPPRFSTFLTFVPFVPFVPAFVFFNSLLIKKVCHAAIGRFYIGDLCI